MAQCQAWKTVFGAAVLAGVCASPAWAVDAQLSVSAAPNPAVVGAPLSLTVLISGITDLFAHQFSLSFNPAVVQATTVTEGAFLGAGGGTTFSAGTVNNSLGRITLVADSLSGFVPGVSGTGVLAKIGFSVTGVGSSTFSFSDVVFLDSALADITVQSTALTLLTVQAVPEPAALALFCLGLAGLVGVAQRRARLHA